MTGSRIRATYVVDLALGLKAGIMLLNPARIVIGGGIGKAGDCCSSRCAQNCGVRLRLVARANRCRSRRSWATTAYFMAHWPCWKRN